jgi:RNA polymerase sigma factor (sigma-70 family)
MTGTPAGVILRHVRDLAGTDRDGSSADADLLQRFTRSRDGAAFEEMVRRHGGLVLGVCRRVLGNVEDAEDALQATFLVLARKAGSIGKGASLPAWLYQVAYRLALRARRQLCCRRQREQLADPRCSGDCLQELTGRELLQVLDEEMQRLPEGERGALVLCYLQGKPRDEAAGLLGWSLSTLKRRLEQARRRLHLRLERRGLTLPVALAVVGLAEAAEAAVPATLVTTTVRAALSPDLIATRAGVLANAALWGMVLGKVKMAGALLLLAAILAAGVGLLAQPAPPPSAPPAAKADGKAPPPPAAPPHDEKRVTIAGRVLDADGKPVAEADVAVLSFPHNIERIAEEDLRFDVLGQTRTDDKGRFRMRVEKRDPVAPAPILSGQMLISARGLGLGLHGLPLNKDHTDELIRLPKERILRGRLIDLQGAGIKGMTVPLLAITGSRTDEPLKAVGRPAKKVPGWPEAPKTDEKGRFVIRGLGEGQHAYLLVHDERFKPQPIQLPAEGKDAAREVVTALTPASWIEGRVTFADTGKPAVGAEVYIRNQRTRTDRDGRYRISSRDGLHDSFAVASPPGTPYVGGRADVPVVRGGGKRRVDVKLRRGLLLHGKVIEEGTGKPVANASAFYWGRIDNPNVTNDMSWGEVFDVRSGADGSFQIPVIPGKGQLLVNGPTADYTVTEIGENQLNQGKPGGARHYAHAVVSFDLATKPESPEVVVKLRRGVKVEGKLIGPRGQPVKGAQVWCRLTINSMFHHSQAQELLLPNEYVVFRGCLPDKGTPALFLDEKNQWGAFLDISGKQAGKPLTIRLEPCGSAVAHFVDGRGKPLPQLPVSVELLLTLGPQRFDYARRDGELAADSVHPPGYSRAFRNRRMVTDAEGRFTFPMLVPGATYRIHWREGDKVCVRDFKVGPGERLDLKDVVIHRE